MRTIFSRILLVLLLGVAIAAAIRFGSSHTDAVVAFEDLNAERLRHEAFRLPAAARFAIDAAGSYEEPGTEASDTTMAATGWIVRRADGAVVWRMRPPRPARGTLVGVRDTVVLDPGTYDVYFASYGDPLVRAAAPRDGSFAERFRAALSRGGRSWLGDASRWRFLVEELTDGADLAETSGFEEDPARDETLDDSSLVWAARGVSDRERREHLFRVTAPTRVRVRSTTEVTDGTVRDVASIVRLGQSDTVWTVRPEATAWAGGALKNRQTDETVDLEPGLYRAAFDADRSHAYDDWEANPPDAPWHWGMEIARLGDPGAVVSLDPESLDLPEIVGFDCVGSNADLNRVFTLAEPTDVLLVAAGEILGGSRYDYGGLDRQDGPDGDEWDEVWEMDRDNTQPGGGSDKNRRAVVALSLEPGTYRLRYETDGSHDCGDGYNSDAPAGSLWGIVLYALDPAFDAGSLGVRASADGPTAAPPDGSAPLVRIDSVANDERREASFTLDAPAAVRVVAAGELSPIERFDYATILDASGETVWEMTWDDTEPAGGSSLNRRFDGRVDLPAGAYSVRYETDSRHAFGSLGPDAPDDVSFWGVHVYGPEE